MSAAFSLVVCKRVVFIFQSYGKTSCSDIHNIVSTGEHSDIAHPINKETRQMFEEAIINAYNEAE